MKKLQTLIKLHKNNVDKTLKEIADYNQQIFDKEAELAKLIKEMQLEMDNYHASEYGPVLENYLSNSRKIQSLIEQNIRALEHRVEHTHILLHDQFAELKKFEIICQNRMKEWKEEESRKETKNIDEINIIRFTPRGG